VSSRLVRSPSGRVCAVVVTTPDIGLEVGHRFAVLGDECRRPHGFGFTGDASGRAPMVDEIPTGRRRRGARMRQAAFVAGAGDSSETTPRPHQHSI
jgi:hypothetical protein